MTNALIEELQAGPGSPLTTQYFADFNQWVTRASMWLTAHDLYGEQFNAICFDKLGRHCRMGRDFMRARDEDAFPVYWLWPDQIGPIALIKARSL